ncbi:MAG: AsmA family protein [Campylobacteraceae bacterium]
MDNLLLKTIKRVCIVALVFIGFICVVLYTTDFNKAKPKISKFAQSIYELNATVNGDVSFSLFPLGLVINGVNIQNPQNFSQDDLMIQNASVRLKLKILPLLIAKQQLKEIEIKSANINMIKNENGEINFDLEEIASKKEVALRFSNCDLSFEDLKISAQDLNLYAVKKAQNIEGSFDVKEIKTQKETIQKANGNFVLQNNNLEIKKLEYTKNGEKINSTFVLDLVQF